MAGKHGILGGPSWLLPVLGGVAALATGGLGLGGLLGGGAADAAGAGAGAAEAAGAGAADLGAGIGTGVGAGLAGDTGLASSLLAAPAIGATGVSSAAAPLAADALAGVGDISGIGAGVGTDIGAAAAGLGDVATGAAPSLFGALTDAGPALTGAEGATAPLGAVTTSALPTVGATAVPGLAASADPSIASAVGSALPGAGSDTGGDLLATATDFSGGTPGATGLSGILNNIAGPLKTASTIGSLGLLVPQLLKGPTTYPEQSQLQSMAGNEVGIANQFLQPLQSGVLPPGAASAVDAAKAANTAAVVNADANLGIGGSTMEAQQLQAVNNAAAGQTFQIADQLAQNALPYSNLATNTTQDLLKTSMTEDADYQAALANFAKALAGLGGTSPTSQATAV